MVITKRCRIYLWVCSVVHIIFFARKYIFTARCYAERGYTTVYRLSVCLSVCDVQVP